MCTTAPFRPHHTTHPSAHARRPHPSTPPPNPPTPLPQPHHHVPQLPHTNYTTTCPPPSDSHSTHTATTHPSQLAQQHEQRQLTPHTRPSTATVRRPPLPGPFPTSTAPQEVWTLRFLVVDSVGSLWDVLLAFRQLRVSLLALRQLLVSLLTLRQLLVSLLALRQVRVSHLALQPLLRFTPAVPPASRFTPAVPPASCFTPGAPPASLFSPGPPPALGSPPDLLCLRSQTSIQVACTLPASDAFKRSRYGYVVPSSRSHIPVALSKPEGTFLHVCKTHELSGSLWQCSRLASRFNATCLPGLNSVRSPLRHCQACTCTFPTSAASRTFETCFPRSFRLVIVATELAVSVSS